MNQKLKYLGMMSAAAALSLCTACNDDPGHHDYSGTGRVSLSVGVNGTTLSSRSLDSRATNAGGIIIPDVQDLTIKTTLVGSGYSKEWASIAELSAEPMPVGTWNIEAYYGDADATGFEAPYFYGIAENVRIKENETTQVGLTTMLANAMVSVSYTEGAAAYLANCSAELKCEGMTEAIEYPADETRPAYVKPGNVDVYVNITKPNGASARLQAATITAAARHHYAITIDVAGSNGSKPGEAVLSVTFDDDLVTEDYQIELSDELMNAPAPAVTAEGFTPGQGVRIIDGQPFNGSIRYTIVARGGLKKVLLTTTNPQNIAANWPASVDLMSMSDADKAAMQGLGLDAKGLWQNPDKMAIIDLSKVLAHMSLGDARQTESAFSLEVVDKYGKASTDAPVLTATIEREAISLSDAAIYTVGEETFSFTLAYNGADPESNVQLQYRNQRGTWSALSGMTCQATAAEGVYTATVPAPAVTESFTIRALNADHSVMSNELTIVAMMSGDISLQASAFAKKADVNVLNGSNSLNRVATLYISADGTSFAEATAATTASGMLRISNLQPSTDYWVKASVSGSIDNACEAIKFTTEEAAQLPNADMEAWSRTNGATNYWWVEYPGANAASAAWATLNPLTTSQGGSSTGAFDSNRNGCSYNAFSGTRSTTDSRSGNAAVIETVGWGQGNSAVGSVSSSNPKHITAGELYLGSFDADSNAPAYGMAFASRPDAVSFYYKYAPKNSADYGEAVVRVLDDQGSVIASGSLRLTAASAYSSAAVPLTYTSAAKAASIAVTFRSSGNADCLTPSGDNLSAPAFGNTSTGRFTGSALYIDDITLNY